MCILDFALIEVRAAVNVMGATPAGKEMLNMNRGGVDEYSYAIKFGKLIHPTITSGASLDAMDVVSIKNISVSLVDPASTAPKI